MAQSRLASSTPANRPRADRPEFGLALDSTTVVSTTDSCADLGTVAEGWHEVKLIQGFAGRTELLALRFSPTAPVDEAPAP